MDDLAMYFVIAMMLFGGYLFMHWIGASVDVKVNKTMLAENLPNVSVNVDFCNICRSKCDNMSGGTP